MKFVVVLEDPVQNYWNIYCRGNSRLALPRKREKIFLKIADSTDSAVVKDKLEPKGSGVQEICYKAYLNPGSARKS